MGRYRFATLLCALFFYHCFHSFYSQSHGNALSSVVDNQEGKKESQLRTYIVHVQRPKHDKLLRDEDVQDWHKSFLPNTTLDVGEPRMLHSYRHAMSGFAARLTAEEVKAMESREGFLIARPSRKLSLSTTYTPSFLGLSRWDGLWPDSFMGSGVIIGVVDSGITPNHASFMDDGTMAPRPVKWKGRCGFRNKTLCNNKLIGALAFRGPRRPSPKDGKKDGHGTHVAGIAAGSFVDNAHVLGLAKGTASGTAPKAHLAMYKACYTQSCDGADVMAAIEQAMKDGVDILSLSLGQGVLAFYDDDYAIATLSAIRAKIFVCMSAGNSGPKHKSVENGAPWILTVGASSHDRRASATVKLGDGVEIEGESGYQPSKFNGTGDIVFPGFKGQNGSLGCLKGSFNNTNVKGKIVLCTIESGKFKDMGINVKKAGGLGMIVLDTFVEGSTTFSDDHVLPTAHVNYTEARKIVTYFKNSNSSTPSATITFNGTKFGARPSPTVAYFSSRGPHAYNGGIIKPDIVGPGVNILSAWPVKPGPNPNNGPPASYFNFQSGTSMATPHLAGIAALLKNTHLNWSAAAVRSAIMTTGDRFDRDGNPILDDYDAQIGPAKFFDMGSGQVNPVAANDPGLIYDIDPENYIQYLCGLGYTDTQVTIVAGNPVQCSIVGSLPPEELNYPSISIYLDPATNKTISRTLTNVGNSNEEYKIDVEEPNGIRVIVSPSPIQFSGIGQEKKITLEFSSKGMPLNQGDVLKGHLKLDSGKHFLRSPISVTIL